MNKLFSIPIPKQSYANYVIRRINNPNLCFDKNKYINLREANSNINCIYKNNVYWYRNTNYFMTVVNYKHKVLIEEMIITALPKNLYNIEYNLEEETEETEFIGKYDYAIKLKLSEDNKSYDFIENKALITSKPFLL